MAVSNMDINQETVYRTNDDSHVVMTEKVQSLAGSVYQEFEKMIRKYDHDVVKDLMPLVVNVLECLDTAYTENQEHEVELELLREDNEQLVTQYEREKQLRKSAEQKLLEVEDLVEDERKDLSNKIESLESLVRMLELKSKNSTDHVFRLEEKENEMKKEYTKLHERYTELFKTHVDYMERSKMLMSTSERLEAPTARSTTRMPSMGLGHMNRSSGPVSFGFQSLEEVRPEDPSLTSEDLGASPHDSTASNTSLHNELNVQEMSGERKGVWSNESSSKHSPIADIVPVMGRSTTNKEERSGNTLYQELSFQDPDILGDNDDGGDVTGSWVHPGEYASSGWKSLRVGIKPRSLKPANDNFFGMGKEVENLIMENNELLATKNALNIVKDDLILKLDELTSEHEMLREQMGALHAMKDTLKQKISDLEEELKKTKEEAAKATKSSKSDDEDDDVPLAQRKRFTRVEMARVLMERNQYKERLLELQDAVRWRDTIIATRADVTYDSTKPRGVWNYFSGLFQRKSEKELPQRRSPSVGVHYSPNRVSPALPLGSGSDRKRPVDYLDRGPVFSEKQSARRSLERREQYRQVRAHVRKEDGRLQAYGWSLPARPAATPDTSRNIIPETGRSHVPVPVPVYCQPLVTTEDGDRCPQLQVWCSAGVNLSGGRTRDGGLIVGGSVFYGDGLLKNKTTSSTVEDSEPHITSLEEELKESEKVREESETLEQRLSSMVWICSSMRSESKVTVLDATDPQRALESFPVCQSYVLCIASVPGAVETDYFTDVAEAVNNNVKVTPESDENENPIGRIRCIQTEPEIANPDEDEDSEKSIMPNTILPTMWLGAQNGNLYVHSAVSNRSKCLVTVRMPDSVLCITHCSGKVLVALANGTVAVFRRNGDAEWNLSQYYTVNLGDAQASVRCMSLVHSTAWCGYKNKIHVLDPNDLTLKTSLEAHPRKESQVRQMAWLGDGVWVSIRLDSTLRLYHAHTYQHLQDVDIEPYVTKMLGAGKLGFSFVRITALLISTERLWIGTGEGVVINVPLSEEAGTQGIITGSTVRVYSDSVTEKLTPGSFIPYCSMSEAQLSFHGHRDSVKFFIAVPGSRTAISNPHMLVMSGGEGYVDFRTGDGVEDENGTIPEEPENDGVSTEYDANRERKVDMSHLIIWQVALPTT